MSKVSRKIKGIWIPIDIWELEELNPAQRCLLAEIDSLSKGDDPCRTGNKYFANFFGVSISTIARTISKLHDMQLIRLWYESPDLL